MNAREKEIAKWDLKTEKGVINALKKTYEQTLADINERIKQLLSDELTQSKIYQVEYQKALKKQVEALLDVLNSKQYDSIQSYLKECYNGGFIGTLYNLQGQGIPLIMPIDADQVANALQTESAISESLYTKLGKDVQALKKQISAEISRGISGGRAFSDIARNLDSIAKIGFNKAVRIARTEGHRIQNRAAMDAADKAKDLGADVVKQWDAALDKKTRPSHAKVDGQLRELDEAFDNGLMYPGDPSGVAAEVVNCRCRLNQRAKWALDENELRELKARADFFGLDKAKDFEDFAKKYNVVLNTIKHEDIDITDGGKFERIRAKSLDEYAERIEEEFVSQDVRPKEIRTLNDPDYGYIKSNGYSDINEYMRGLKPKLKVPRRNVTIKVAERATRNNALKKNYIGTRKADMDYLKNVLGTNIDGLERKTRRKNGQGKYRDVMVPRDFNAAQKIVDYINSLIGTDAAIVKDEAFTSVSLCEDLNYFTHYPIKFEIQMPEGTRGLITNNVHESEFMAQNGSSIEILGSKVYNDNGDACVLIYGRMIQDE